MKKTIINPWKWQDNLGYAQAVEVKNSNGTLYCAGQAAMNGEGQPVAGTMEEQIKLCLANLEQVTLHAGYELKNIVRLNLYTTNIGEFFGAYGALAGWLAQNGAMPSSTLLEVSGLAYPELKVEIEATVVA
jgi:2-iminobutanoate/2-iminopropanoate deaminase